MTTPVTTDIAEFLLSVENVSLSFGGVKAAVDREQKRVKC